MPTRRHAHGNAGNTAHLAHCEPTLELMESIAATIPDALFNARKEAWEAGYAAGQRSSDYRTDNPYGMVPAPEWAVGQVDF